jgi:hypothetical protein
MTSKNINPASNDLLFPEIFAKISKVVGNKKKADLITEFRNSVHGDALKTLVLLIYNHELKFRLPEGEPPYTPNVVPIGTDHSRLLVEHRNLYRFIVGGAPQLSQNKIEMLYIELLESLHESESDLLIRIFNRSFDTIWKGTRKYVIPFDAIKLAFPEIQWKEPPLKERLIDAEIIRDYSPESV